MSLTDLTDLLRIILPPLINTETAKIQSVIGVIEFICLVVEKISQEYKSEDEPLRSILANTSNTNTTGPLSSASKTILALEAGSQIIDFLHTNNIISDSMLFDAKAIIGIQSVLSGMITDIIRIWNKNRRIQISQLEDQHSCCGCWPWSRVSKKTIYQAPGDRPLNGRLSPREAPPSVNKVKGTGCPPLAKPPRKRVVSEDTELGAMCLKAQPFSEVGGDPCDQAIPTKPVPPTM